MKVLHVLRDLSRDGGVQRLVYDMLNRPPAGVQMEVAVSARVAGAEYIDELRAGGVPVHEVPRWHLWRWWRLLRRFEVVHAHLFPGLYLVGLLRRGQLYTEHNTTNNRRRIRAAYLLERWVYGRYHTVTCVSPETRAALLAFLRRSQAGNARVVYNGVDLDSFRAARAGRADADQDGAFHLVMVGSLTAKKDQATLIRAMALLPPDIHLHLGGEGPQRAVLEALIAELGVQQRVTLHGVVRDIPAFLADKQLYIQASHWEGFGLAAVEAMAAGLPVLCADVPGLNGLADSRELLFERADHRGLADMILRCRDDSGYRRRLLQIGERTCAAYSLERMQAEYTRLYREVADVG